MYGIWVVYSKKKHFQLYLRRIPFGHGMCFICIHTSLVANIHSVQELHSATWKFYACHEACILLLQLQCTDTSLVSLANTAFTHDFCGYQSDDSIRCDLTAHNTAGSSAKQTAVKTETCVGKLFLLFLMLLICICLGYCLLKQM